MVNDTPDMERCEDPLCRLYFPRNVMKDHLCPECFERHHGKDSKPLTAEEIEKRRQPLSVREIYEPPKKELPKKRIPFDLPEKPESISNETQKRRQIMPSRKKGMKHKRRSGNMSMCNQTTDVRPKLVLVDSWDENECKRCNDYNPDATPEMKSKPKRTKKRPAPEKVSPAKPPKITKRITRAGTHKSCSHVPVTVQVICPECGEDLARCSNCEDMQKKLDSIREIVNEA